MCARGTWHVTGPWPPPQTAPSAANLLLCGHGPWSPTGQCVPAILGATQPVGLSQGKLWRQEQPLPLPCSWVQASPAIPKWRADRPTPAPNPGPLLPPQAEKRWRERQAGTAALSTAPPQCPETPTYSHLTGREQGLTAAHSPSDPAGLLPQPGEQEAGPQSVRETPPGLWPPAAPPAAAATRWAPPEARAGAPQSSEPRRWAASLLRPGQHGPGLPAAGGAGRRPGGRSGRPPTQPADRPSRHTPGRTGRSPKGPLVGETPRTMQSNRKLMRSPSEEDRKKTPAPAEGGQTWHQTPARGQQRCPRSACGSLPGPGVAPPPSPHGAHRRGRTGLPGAVAPQGCSDTSPRVGGPPGPIARLPAGKPCEQAVAHPGPLTAPPLPRRASG